MPTQADRLLVDTAKPSVRIKTQERRARFGIEPQKRAPELVSF